VIAYARSRGHAKFAAMIPETPYGDRVQSSFTAAVNSVGGRIVATETYQPDTSRLSDPVRELTDYDARNQAMRRERAFLKSLGDDDFAQQILASLGKDDAVGAVKFDAVLLPEGAALLRAMAPLFPYFDVDTDKVQFLGTGLWNDPTLLREPQLKDGWFASPDPAQSEAFLARYTALFREQAPRIATLSYDAVALVETLAHEHGKPDFSAAAITARDGFSGIDGIFRFEPDGTNERGLAILEIEPSGFKVISPAPKNFAGFEDMMSGKAEPQAAPNNSSDQKSAGDNVEQGNALGGNTQPTPASP
jgi:hypothetical protein